MNRSTLSTVAFFALIILGFVGMLISRSIEHQAVTADARHAALIWAIAGGATALAGAALVVVQMATYPKR